jgi:hypothetical protein
MLNQHFAQAIPSKHSFLSSVHRYVRYLGHPELSEEVLSNVPVSHHGKDMAASRTLVAVNSTGNADLTIIPDITQLRES